MRQGFTRRDPDLGRRERAAERRAVRTAKNGLTWREPPYTREEQEKVDRLYLGPPIAIYRRRETPAAEPNPPAAEGSDAAPSPTPKRP
jgi:hypothetical protein